LLRNSIAVTRQFKDANGDRATDFIPIICWGKQAEFVAKYIKKGTLVGVDGELRTRAYFDNNNNKRIATEVNVHSIEALESRATVEMRQATKLPAEAQQQMSQGQATQAPEINMDFLNDIPLVSNTPQSQQGDQASLDDLNAQVDAEYHPEPEQFTP
jgi:single stranded DNA-binding protein